MFAIAKQQKILAIKEDVRAHRIEQNRVAAVVRKHEELHPLPTEDCPICLEPMCIIDGKGHIMFLCCGKSFCSDCDKDDREHRHMKSCPMCRSPLITGELNVGRAIKAHAEDGRAWAQHDLGRFYTDGSNGFHRDEVEGLKWIQRSADQNHPGGCYAMGKAYIDGALGERDYGKALYWFERGSNSGCNQSQGVAGAMYHKVWARKPIIPTKAGYYCTLAHRKNESGITGFVVLVVLRDHFHWQGII